MALICCTSF